MDVFHLRDEVIKDYESFATSFTKIHAADIQEQVGRIYDNGRFWPEPLLQLNPEYQQRPSVEDLAAKGLVARECRDIFRAANGPLALYRHQEQAAALDGDLPDAARPAACRPERRASGEHAVWGSAGGGVRRRMDQQDK